MSMSDFYKMHQSARGLYKVAVVDAFTKKVVWEQPDWGKNLILNTGMDRLAVGTWCDCFLYGIAGTGVTPTRRYSNEVSADQAGTTVTATVGSLTFTSGDIANMIKWDSGAEARITGYTSGQQVTVTPSQVVASGPFTVYHTNQTGLATEIKRSNTYLTGAPYCQSAIDLPSATLKNRRTYDFTVESGPVSYTEVGVGWAAAGASTTFSRILLPAAIPLAAGQQLRLVYELQVTIAPSTPQSLSAAVSGWPVAPSVNTDATQQVQLHGLTIVNTSGQTTSVSGGIANEPCRYANDCRVFCSASSTAFAAFNTNVSRNVAGWGSAATTLSAYVPLSFTLDKTGTLDVAVGNMLNIRTIGIGDYAWNNNSDAVTYPPFVVLFAQDQAKTNTQTLTLTFRSSWSRTLS